MRYLLATLILCCSTTWADTTSSVTLERQAFNALSGITNSDQLVKKLKGQDQKLLRDWIQRRDLTNDLTSVNLKKEELFISGQKVAIFPALHGAIVMSGNVTLPVFTRVDLKTNLTIWDQMYPLTRKSSFIEGLFGFKAHADESQLGSSPSAFWGALGVIFPSEQERVERTAIRVRVVNQIPLARELLRTSLYSLNCSGQANREIDATIGYPLNSQEDGGRIRTCLQAAQSPNDRIACLYHSSSAAPRGDRALLTRWTSSNEGGNRSVRVALIPGSGNPVPIDSFAPSAVQANAARAARGEAPAPEQNQELRAAVGELLFRACSVNDRPLLAELQRDIAANRARLQAATAFTQQAFRSPPSAEAPVPTAPPATTTR